MSLRYSLFSNNIARHIRNFIGIKKTIALKPKNKEDSISDFFFWKNSSDFKTKFFLTNLASQILPEINQIDNIKILIYDNKGNLIKQLKYNLKYFETIEIYFENLGVNGFGSFLVFHSFKNNLQLIKNKSHIAERGYIGYSINNQLWNFMHGNNYSAFENTKNSHHYSIRSILAKSLKVETYMPQVTFNDCESFELIINNPSHKNIKIKISFFDKQDIEINQKDILIPSMGTLINLHDAGQINKVRVFSNFIMLRPIIKKNYRSYFDVFHG